MEQSIDEILNEIEKVFRTVFDEPDLQISKSMTANEVELWDSLSHIEMLTEVESVFEINIPFEEVVSMSNVGDLAAYILRNGKQ